METVTRLFVRAARSLARSPTLSATIVFLLATGIAGWTTMFSILDGLILRPLPVREQGQILLGWRADFKRGDRGLPLTEAQLGRFAATTRAFEETSTISAGGATLMAQKVADGVIFAKGLVVGNNFFSLLGTGPLLGRTLGPTDDQPGAPPAVVIGYDLWQRQFGGTRDVLQRTLRSSGREHLVVGVMPKGFDLPSGAEMWFPLLDAAPLGAPRANWAYLAIVGRLKPGANPEAARQEFEGFLREEERSAPAELPNASADVRSLSDYVIGDVRALILLFTAASALLLVLACVNVANLLLVRGTARHHEQAVQLALGANRSQLTWQILAESLLLAVGALGLGMGFSFAAIRAFVSLAPADLPRLAEVAFNGRAMVGAVVSVLLSILVFGLAPALALSRSATVEALRSGGERQTDSRRTRVAKRAIVVGQVALAQLILVSAGLLINSWMRLETVRLGFEPANLTMARLAVGFQFADSGAYHRFLAEALPRVAAIPGVEQVSIGSTPPISNEQWFGSYFEAGGQAGAGLAGNPIATIDAIGPSFFETVHTPVVRGREFELADFQGPAALAIVSQAFVRRTWPGQDPIGRRVRLIQGGRPGQWHTVVGVAADSRYYHLRGPDPTIYIPYTQSDEPPFYLVVRSRVPITAAALLGSLRGVTSEVWIPQLLTLPQVLSGPMARPRLNTMVLTCFAVLSLLMSAGGIYGLCATVVRQRRRELGIRLALGALPSKLLLLVVGEGIALSLGGAAIGVVGGVLVSRGLADALFEITPTDPVTIVVVAGAILLVGLLASVVPGRRAAAVDPASVLRGEA